MFDDKTNDASTKQFSLSFALSSKQVDILCACLQQWPMPIAVSYFLHCPRPNGIDLHCMERSACLCVYIDIHWLVSGSDWFYDWK